MKRWMILLAALLVCLCGLACADGLTAKPLTAATPTDLDDDRITVDTWLMSDLTRADGTEPLAEDITQQVLLNGEMDKEYLNEMRDGNHRTYWESNKYKKEHELLITPPEGKAVGGVVIKWRNMDLLEAQVQVRDESGQWVTVGEAGGLFVTQYIPVPGVTEEFRITAKDIRQRLQFCEIEVYTVGRLPKHVQVWQNPPEKVDMLQIVGHPDDEVLWFGGLLPTYAGEEKKDVLVAVSSYRVYHRRLELLDGLWTAGVRIHPIFLHLTDKVSNDMHAVLNFWGYENAYRAVGRVICQYRPDVLVLQDEKGEYGHGVHRAITYAAKKAVELCNDPTWIISKELGTWNVPKVYIHLYQENQIQMDWKKPLAAFGGKTGLEVATESFRCHVTQQGRWDVWDGGKWDNSLFGLWHTTVGPDEIGGDMFEHID